MKPLLRTSEKGILLLLALLLVAGSPAQAADVPFFFTASDEDLSALSPQDLDRLISERSALAGIPPPSPRHERM